MEFLDFLFPKRCINCKKQGSYLCENCFIFLSFNVKNLCLFCNRFSFNNLTHPRCRRKYFIDGSFSALSYNSIARKLIYNFKKKPYLKDLKTVLSELFYESIIQNENFNKELARKNFIFIPIPLKKSDFQKRGYNQAEILAKELANRFGFRMIDVLKIIKGTDSKTETLIDQQKLDIYKFEIRNMNIFLVDDLLTTGLTLKEAAKVLKKAGAKRVIGLTLARD